MTYPNDDADDAPRGCLIGVLVILLSALLTFGLAVLLLRIVRAP